MGNNNFTKQYSDGAGLTTAMLDIALQSSTLDISNTTQMVAGSTSGQALTSNGPNLAASFQTIPDPIGPFAIRNYGLSSVASSGTLKVTLTTAGGVTPSTTNPVDVTFSTNGTSQSTYKNIQVTAITNITIPASATLGFTGTSTNRVYVYAVNTLNSAATRLGISARSDLDQGGVIAPLALTASSKDATTLYATSNTSVMPRLLGWVESAMNSSVRWQSPSRVNLSNMVVLDKGGVVLSSSSGNYTTTGTAVAAITNLSVSVTTLGGPVEISLVPDGTSNFSNINSSANTVSTQSKFQITRGGTAIYNTLIDNSTQNQTFTAIQVPPSVIRTYDVVGPGTYTYVVNAIGNTAGTTTGCAYAKLLVKVG